MATPRKPKASGDGTEDRPADTIEEAVVMDAAPANPDPAPFVETDDKPLQDNDNPSVIEMQSAPAEPHPFAEAEARIAELSERVAAAERAAAARPSGAVTVKKGSPIPGIVGGVIAAAIGFGAAQVVPQGWPIGDTTDLRATVATQGQTIEKLTADLAAIPAPQAAPTVDLAPLEQQITALADRVAAAEAAAAAAPAPVDNSAALSALESRVKALESLPPGTVIEGSATVDPAATAAVEQQIAALKAEMAAQNEAAKAAVAEVTAAAEAARTALADAQAEAAKLKDESSAAAQTAAASAALGRLTAALETGAPYETAVADLTAAGHTLPPVLADNAATGLPTLDSLQDSFPDAARAALEESLKADMGDTTTERITTFLRTQVGVRSLEPREGTDPDAVLSRAEAAVEAGDLGAALAEVATLPEAGQAAMDGWVAQATLRINAAVALDDLSATVGG